jgi:hypothetical protein
MMHSPHLIMMIATLTGWAAMQCNTLIITHAFLAQSTAEFGH